MKMEAFLPAIPELVPALGSSAQDALRCAIAITTTDLVSKSAALQVGGLGLALALHGWGHDGAPVRRLCLSSAQHSSSSGR
jgi:glutamate N-acetyltransferase/amino-acid N-acetyltransferase